MEEKKAQQHDVFESKWIWLLELLLVIAMLAGIFFLVQEGSREHYDFIENHSGITPKTATDTL